MKRKYNIEQAARNYQLAEGISSAVINNYDRGLWRGPRILLPIELDALVVTPENQDQDQDQDQDQGWARVRIRPETLAGYKEEKAAYHGEDQLPDNGDEDDTQNDPNDPKGGRRPFDSFDSRPPGVYLHWSLPDGLTRGRTVSETAEEAEPTEPSDIIAEQPDPEVPEDTEFPLVPDRWLVVRIYPGETPVDKRRVRAWVIRAEEPDPQARVIPLEAFTENRDAAAPRWMTAMGEGDPAYAAYYDNVENQLGFHDGLEDVDTGPLAYLVAGWYSDRTDDPLYSPSTASQWLNALDELGWALGEDNEKALSDWARAEYGRRVTWMKAGLDSDAAEDESAAFYEEREEGEEVSQWPASSSSRDTARFMNPSITDLPEFADDVIIAEDSGLQKYWPRQIMCHAMTYCVPWGGRGGEYDVASAGKPDPENLQVAIGHTGVETLSALLAESSGSRRAERIFNAYHYGMLSELKQPDGLASLESLLHAEDFESRPGGFVTDTIEQGDAFPSLSSSEANTVTLLKDPAISRENDSASVLYRSTKQNRAAIYREKRTRRVFAFSRKDIALARDGLQIARDPGSSLPGPNPRKTVTIRRAMPRYWEPKDPVILFSRARRSFKHGEDTRRTLDEKLVCRFSKETISGARVMIGSRVSSAGENPEHIYEDIRPEHISEADVQTGQVPPEAERLFNEALFLDLDNAAIAAAQYRREKENGDLERAYPPDTYQLEDLSAAAYARRYQVQITLDKNLLVHPELDAQTYAVFDGKEGRAPAEFAQKPWRRPWNPLHFDWEVEFIPSGDRNQDWQLDEHDYEAEAGADQGAQTRQGIRYQGSTLLTPAVSRTIADRLVKFLEDEAEEEADLADNAQETTLGDIVDALDKLDITAGSLSGFHDYLMARVDDFEFYPLADAEGRPVSPPGLEEKEAGRRRIDLPRFDVRAGHLKITRLRIVDTFGQFVELPQEQLAGAIKAEDGQAGPEAPELVRLPPRITQPSRLMFRMVQSDNDQLDATKKKSPICGWLLPDHLDSALEFFDARGANLGQIQRFRPRSGEIITSSLQWQGVPGDPAGFGAPPALPNPHLQGIVEGLLAQGEQDALRARTGEAGETALSAMLRMIDATLWTVDPLGREGDEHLSVLVGRPLAVVRASLRLESLGMEEESELKRTPFDVRLGELTRLGDGLIGYFVNDDYSRFFPVHEAIANQTRAVRPHHGFMGEIRSVAPYSAARHETSEPVTHPFINEAPFVRVRPVSPGLERPAGRSVMLTLLIDPRGGVHATSGILPRKKIELMREHVAAALENMSVTFRIGPVLSDPATIRMPLPAEIRGNWSWVRKTGLTVWEESPVVDAVPEPKLTPTPSRIHEGWLKLSGYESADEKD